MNNALITTLAQELLEASDNKQPIAYISTRYPSATIQDAYAIQAKVLSFKITRGERIIGHKIGLTTKAVQQQLKVKQPDFGTMTDANLHLPGSALSLSDYIAPQLEAELAFHMKTDLTAGPISSWQLRKAIDGISPAFEVVDTRFGHYQFTIVDTIADAASYGNVILGNVIKPIENLELDCIGLNIYHNGDFIKSATSAEVMGNPLHALHWLVNQLLAHGRPVRAGDIILSGSLTPFLPCAPGDFFEARFAGIGQVSLKIAK